MPTCCNNTDNHLCFINWALPDQDNVVCNGIYDTCFCSQPIFFVSLRTVGGAAQLHPLLSMVGIVSRVWSHVTRHISNSIMTRWRVSCVKLLFKSRHQNADFREPTTCISFYWDIQLPVTKTLRIPCYQNSVFTKLRYACLSTDTSNFWWTFSALLSPPSLIPTL